jgi:hypothetical protein
MVLRDVSALVAVSANTAGRWFCQQLSLCRQLLSSYERSMGGGASVDTTEMSECCFCILFAQS